MSQQQNKYSATIEIVVKIGEQPHEWRHVDSQPGGAWTLVVQVRTATYWVLLNRAGTGSILEPVLDRTPVVCVSTPEAPATWALSISPSSTIAARQKPLTFSVQTGAYKWNENNNNNNNRLEQSKCTEARRLQVGQWSTFMASNQETVT